MGFRRRKKLGVGGARGWPGAAARPAVGSGSEKSGRRGCAKAPPAAGGARRRFGRWPMRRPGKGEEAGGRRRAAHRSICIQQSSTDLNLKINRLTCSHSHIILQNGVLWSSITCMYTQIFYNVLVSIWCARNWSSRKRYRNPYLTLAASVCLPNAQGNQLRMRSGPYHLARILVFTDLGNFVEGSNWF